MWVAMASIRPGERLAGSPRLLMVDEMSLGLAPIVVEGLLPVLRRIADEWLKDSGTTNERQADPQSSGIHSLPS